MMLGEPQLQVIRGLFYGNYAPPDLPSVPSLRPLIQVHSKPFEKQLTSSDVKDDQSRLSINKDVENHIFPLLKDDEDPNQGVHVTIYDMDGKEYPMVFKTWMSKIHVLTGGWNSFRQDRGLVEKIDFVTVWVFRNVVNGAFASPSIQECFRQCPKPSREEGSAEKADRRYKVCIHIVLAKVYFRGFSSYF